MRGQHWQASKAEITYVLLMGLASILRLGFHATDDASKGMILAGDLVLDQVIPVVEKDITGLAILLLVCHGSHDAGFTNGG